jgi:hypothetical protein
LVAHRADAPYVTWEILKKRRLRCLVQLGEAGAVVTGSRHHPFIREKDEVKKGLIGSRWRRSIRDSELVRGAPCMSEEEWLIEGARRRRISSVEDLIGASCSCVCACERERGKNRGR